MTFYATTKYSTGFTYSAITLLTFKLRIPLNCSGSVSPLVAIAMCCLFLVEKILNWTEYCLPTLKLSANSLGYFSECSDKKLCYASPNRKLGKYQYHSITSHMNSCTQCTWFWLLVCLVTDSNRYLWKAAALTWWHFDELELGRFVKRVLVQIQHA